VRRLEVANQSDGGNKVLKQFGESRMINYRQVQQLQRPLSAL
jgi:hypothetical protein